MDSNRSSARNGLLIAAGIIFTAAAYFVANSLQPVWWLSWLAPLPVLLIAPRMRAWQAFAAAFAARAFAGLDLWYYLRHDIQIPMLPALASILIPALFFALAVLLFHALLRKGSTWLAMLAFPAVIVAAEYLFSLAQGTFGNTGYTQLKNLPILQLAALSGLWGISFTVHLFSAGIAVIVAAPDRNRWRIAAALALYYVCVLTYGLARLHQTPQTSQTVLVGMVETHSGSNMFPRDAKTSTALFNDYAQQAKLLAAQGAQFVVLPEMSSLVPDAASAQVDAFFQQTARAAHVQILLGVIHVTNHGAFNEARLYSASGEIEAVYRKHHLVPSLEARATPGSGISVLPQPAGKIGIEICRDMDYPELARRYAQRQVGLILVPAWDQGVDAVWHGHMALMRGIEDGFTLVRDAKVGLLTASDDRGRIIAEKPTRDDGAIVTMLATVPVRHDATLYALCGDWFAWLDLAGLAAIVLYAGFSPNRSSAAA
jgi:apolipoprotein N-acyltransferase